MSDQDLPPLPADIEGLLRDAPRPVPPPGFGPGVLGRIKDTLGAPPPPPPPAPPSKMGSWGMPVSAAALVVGATVGVFVGTQLRPPPPPPPAPVVVQVPAPAPEPTPAPTPDPQPAPAPPSPKPVVRVPPLPAPPARDLDLSDERALVEMARSALARGETQKAITVLEDHVRRFPNGQLTEERESLLIQALVNAGQPEAARKRADAFKARFPESMLWPAIDAALR